MDILILLLKFFGGLLVVFAVSFGIGHLLKLDKSLKEMLSVRDIKRENPEQR